jgi:5,10-methylenetetrahydromethanopterin reductase
MIGVLVPPHLPAEHLVGYAQKAEQLGFPEAWVVEDCFLHGAFAQAATILASTTSLHVGLGIIPAAARNVAFTAMEVATLAGLHPGRLTVGVGHGIPSPARHITHISGIRLLVSDYLRRVGRLPRQRQRARSGRDRTRRRPPAAGTRRCASNNGLMNRVTVFNLLNTTVGPRADGSECLGGNV